MQKNSTFWEKHWTKNVQINEKINKYKPLFVKMEKQLESRWDGHIDQPTVAKHHYVLKSAMKPNKHLAPYRAVTMQRKLKREEVSKVQEGRVTEHAIENCASPIVIVPKKNGHLRLWVDYRRLKSITERDSYTVFEMDEHIDSSGKAQILSPLTASSGY